VILLDTNVVSEPLKLNPNPTVVAWIDAQVIETLCLSTISVTELRYGIAVLPDGKRKQVLRRSLDKRVLPLFASRILPFDIEAAEICAELRARARALGKGISTADSYIAAIAVARSLTVATRDTEPFAAVGATVVNPWESAIGGV
jgi:predicted nucleic acid-binding protein